MLRVLVLLVKMPQKCSYLLHFNCSCDQENVIEFVVDVGPLLSFFEEACRSRANVSYYYPYSLWSSVLLEIGCYNYLGFHRKEILRLNSVLLIGHISLKVHSRKSVLVDVIS